MSLEPDEIQGMFTEAERAAGIAAIFAGSPQPVTEKKEASISSSRQLRATRTVASLSSIDEIKRSLINSLFIDEIDYMSTRYAKNEGLPAEYKAIAKERNCLNIMIKGMLQKNCKVIMSQENIESLDLLISTIYENKEFETVYERVGRIQNFIHATVINVYGDGMNENLPIRTMRHLLSAARLHLFIHEIKHKDCEYLLAMARKSEGIANKEFTNPSTGWSPSNKKKIKNWRVRGMRPFDFFFSSSNRNRIERLVALNSRISVEDYKKEAIEIYSVVNI